MQVISEEILKVLEDNLDEQMFMAINMLEIAVEEGLDIYVDTTNGLYMYTGYKGKTKEPKKKENPFSIVKEEE